MNAELTASLAEHCRRLAPRLAGDVTSPPAAPETDSRAAAADTQQRYYDDVYFDSDDDSAPEEAAGPPTPADSESAGGPAVTQDSASAGTGRPTPAVVENVTLRLYGGMCIAHPDDIPTGQDVAVEAVAAPFSGICGDTGLTPRWESGGSVVWDAR